MMNEHDEKMMMEEALKDFENVSQGNIVKGRIEKIGPEEVFLNINYKSEGRISLNEFQDLDIKPEEGMEVRALITRIDDRKGNVRLSMKEALRKDVWENLLEAHSNEDIIKVRITSRIKGGFEVMFQNIQKCFMPHSLLGNYNGDPLGQEMDVVIIELNRRTRNIIVSHKAIQDKKKEKAFAEVFENLKEGDLVKGKVSRITDFGAFIDFGGVEGLLHRTDISWGRVDDIKEYFSEGDELEPVILKLDRNRFRISLGLKQKTPEPWSVINEKYNEGEEVKGKVKNITEFGAFVEIEPGLEGLLHISDMSWKKVISPKSVVKKGDVIKVKILDINKEDKRISLGIKQLTQDPWEKIEEICPEGETVTGKVSKITNRGFFVELKDEIEGFVHITDMAWGRKLTNPSEMVTDGQEIEVKVINIDKDNRRLNFSLKHMTQNPWETVKEEYAEGQVVDGKVSNITNFGAFIMLPNGLEGLLHLSDLSWTRKVNHPTEVINEGQELKVKILGIDTDEKRISLGLKQLEKDPWEEVSEKYPLDSVVEGTVTNLKNFGAFVEIADGIEGLLHVNDLSWKDNKVNIEDFAKKGDTVKVKIIDIDKNKKQINLGIKQLEENPFEKFREGLTVKGKVREILNFGVIIELEPDVTGLVHVSELSEEHVENIEDFVSTDDEVDVKILENNPEDKKIRLSMKQAAFGKVAQEFMLDNSEAGGVSVGDKLKKAMNSKK